RAVEGGQGRSRDARQAAAGVDTEVYRLADLAGEAEHVRIQPVLQQGRFLDLVGGAMGGSLVDDAGQGAELLGARSDGRIVQRICHFVSPGLGFDETDDKPSLLAS